MTSRYNFDISGIDKKKVERRFEFRKVKRRRLKTNCGNADDYLKGFPYGFTLVWGRSGCGKTALAARLALTWARAGYKVLFVITEKASSLPGFPKGHPNREANDNIFGMNYTSFRPYYRRKDDSETPRILAEILYGIQLKDADVCIIDSFTGFISSNKAIDEADMRDAALTLAKKAEGNLPVIGISQVRGQGQWTYPAGGQGVLHSTQMTIKMDKKLVDTPWDAEMYGSSKGSYVYTMSIDNDVEGKAAQDEDLVVYHGLDHTLDLSSIGDIRRGHQDQIREGDG